MANRRGFGNIRPRKRLDGKNSYAASYLIPGTKNKRRTRTFRARNEAKAWLKEQEKLAILGKLDQPTPPPKPVMPTVKEYAQTWLNQLESRNASPNTMRSRISILRKHILPTLGEYHLDELDRHNLTCWYNRLDPAKPGARQNAYRTLLALLNNAVEEELIDSCPLKIKGAMAKPRVRNEARERVASIEQVEQIAALMPADMGIVVFLAAWAGLRYGEIAALRRKHIDLENRVIKVRAAVKRDPRGGYVEGEPKSRMSVRDIPIPPRLFEVLETHLGQFVGKDRESLIVYSPADRQKFLTNRSLHARFDRAAAVVGLEGFWFHQLRATCATWLMRSGATPAEIQAILGHSDWATSQLYQRAPRERLQQVMDKLTD